MNIATIIILYNLHDIAKIQSKKEKQISREITLFGFFSKNFKPVQLNTFMLYRTTKNRQIIAHLKISVFITVAYYKPEFENY